VTSLAFNFSTPHAGETVRVRLSTASDATTDVVLLRLLELNATTASSAGKEIDCVRRAPWHMT